MNVPAPIEVALRRIEVQYQTAAKALLGDDPVRLQETVAQLQQLSAEFLTLMRSLSPTQCSAVQQRVAALSIGMIPLREGVLRHLALVDRHLQVIMPAAAGVGATGYAASVKSPYASAARQSGAFKFLSA